MLQIKTTCTRYVVHGISTNLGTPKTIKTADKRQAQRLLRGWIAEYCKLYLAGETDADVRKFVLESKFWIEKQTIKSERMPFNYC